MKIGELTLNEVADICKRCDEDDGVPTKVKCPFTSVLLVDCFSNGVTDVARRLNLDKELDENSIGGKIR